jgi:hypothetical protein
MADLNTTDTLSVGERVGVVVGAILGLGEGASVGPDEGA